MVRRLRWLALVSAFRAIFRRSAGNSVDRAAADLKDRLPTPLGDVLEAMPGDPLKVGGSALATGRGARSAYRLSRRAGGSVSRAAQRVSDGGRAAGDVRRRLSTEIRTETEQQRRLLWSRYRRSRGDHIGADDAMLDLRPNDADSGPVPEIPDPVPVGRRRAVEKPQIPVNRRRRSYRRPARPWD